MNKTELKNSVMATGSHFFERSSMKFFGDTMANYYVPVHPVKVTRSSGERVLCWELQRRRPVFSGPCSMQKSAFFNVETFERVLPAIS